MAKKPTRAATARQIEKTMQAIQTLIIYNEKMIERLQAENKQLAANYNEHKLILNIYFNPEAQEAVLIIPIQDIEEQIKIHENEKHTGDAYSQGKVLKLKWLLENYNAQEQKPVKKPGI